MIPPIALVSRCRGCSLYSQRSFAFGSCDLAQALEWLRAVLDRAELIHALNRMNRTPVARLEAVPCSTKNKFKRPTPPSRGPSPPS